MVNWKKQISLKKTPRKRVFGHILGRIYANSSCWKFSCKSELLIIVDLGDNDGDLHFETENTAFWRPNGTGVSLVSTISLKAWVKYKHHHTIAIAKK